MGGTSFDIGLVVEGGIKHYDFSPVIDRWLVSLPMVHLTALGAGGGSIARVDDIYKTIKVGPDSAGSDPGPACYNRGGREPTVTDADLILGYLDPDNYAHGSIALNPRRSLRAMAPVCDVLGLEPVEVAKLIKRRADADMANGILGELRIRGYRVDDFTLLAYGGNGPLHGCGIAGFARINRIMTPPYASVFAACGASSLDQMHFHEYSRISDLYNPVTGYLFDDYDAFNSVVMDLENRGRDDLLRQGADPDAIEYRLELDMRYGTQTMETTIVANKRRVGSVRDVLELIERLAVDYGRRYGDGSQAPESGIRIMTFRVAAFVRNAALEFEQAATPAGASETPAPRSVRDCHFVGQDDALATPVYGADALTPGVVIEGPAIVNPGETTYLVEPGWRFEAAGAGGAWFRRISDPS
jgi:N-methylhydantoinase A